MDVIRPAWVREGDDSEDDDEEEERTRDLGEAAKRARIPGVADWGGRRRRAKIRK